MFDALGGTRGACVLGELFSSTSPRRPAVRLDPTRPLYVRVLDSTGGIREVCRSSSPENHRSALLRFLQFRFARSNRFSKKCLA